MASSGATRPSVVAPSIYGQDDTDKYAALMAKTGEVGAGTLGALMLGASASHQKDVQDYYQQIAAANQLQMALSKQQDLADLTKEAFGKLPDLIGHGQNPADIPLAAQFYAPGVNMDQAAQTVRALKIAQAAEAYAKAAHAGEGGADKYAQEVRTDINGNVIDVLNRHQSRSPIPSPARQSNPSASGGQGPPPTTGVPPPNPNRGAHTIPGTNYGQR